MKMPSILRPDGLLPALAPAQQAKSSSSLGLAGSKHHTVNVLTSMHAMPREISVLVTDLGSIYEIGELVRHTRTGSVHRIHRLLRANLSTDCYVRSPERLAVKVHDKQATLAMQMKGSQESPLNEMRVLSMLSQHDNVLAAQEMFSDTDHFYIVMPFLSGGDLLDVMERNSMTGQQRMQPSEAKAMFRDVLQGLSHLHSAGIAHRDLSIENILYDQDNDRFVIIDLGMCLHGLPSGSAATPCKGVCGKPNYIAPEVWSQTTFFDPMACDLWAAAVVLFMALTASAPMNKAVPSDPHYVAIANNRLSEVLKVAVGGEQGDGVDADILLAADLMQKMLKPDPRDRLSLLEVFAHPWLRSV